MNPMLPALLSSVFLVLALWHFYMAWTPATGVSGAVPSVDGRPLFVPSTHSTVAVGVVLVMFAVLVAGAGGIVTLGLPADLLRWFSFALALGLLARPVACSWWGCGAEAEFGRHGQRCSSFVQAAEGSI
jgi:hypothetical protein